MLDLRNIRNVSIIGGGTAGWFAALLLRNFLPSNVNISLFESSEIGIVGVGEGGLINLIETLNRLKIPTSEFMRETGASFKWGFCYEGWRNGLKNDEYYHLFPNPLIKPFSTCINGFYPEISELVSKNVPLSDSIPAFDAIKKRVSQIEAAKILVKGDQGISSSLHFDSYKVAKFLSKKASERGISHFSTKVKDILINHDGLAEKIITEDGNFLADFVVDASGFSRFVIEKKLKTRWISFKEYLWLDKAIPFHIPHYANHPELVTRATAMQSGWMWQIPLRDRIGAGYVFSSEFTNEESAIHEIENYLGFEIEPHKTLNFEPGYFEKIWQKNIVSIGLSSGFVEPLEATSIGLMLEQLRMLEKIIIDSGYIISELSIEKYNQGNASSWDGIRDFLRMHYDCSRNDTLFWEKVAKTPYPETYKILKDILKKRNLRLEDIKIYSQHGWNGIFHVINWMFVAQGLGIVSAESSNYDLNFLSESLS
ncbi:tryptophan halogenase family protein [Acinetobacter soli]|uniref:tryptophan halogenase family protein n=1 Tax=Acinetobacter soli TaxID=487316 RepID=UPI0032B59006